MLVLNIRRLKSIIETHAEHIVIEFALSVRGCWCFVFVFVGIRSIVDDIFILLVSKLVQFELRLSGCLGPVSIAGMKGSECTFRVSHSGIQNVSMIENFMNINQCPDFRFACGQVLSVQQHITLKLVPFSEVDNSGKHRQAQPKYSENGSFSLVEVDIKRVLRKYASSSTY